MVTVLQLGLNRYFYWGMSMLICLVVAMGFGPHLGDKLLHPAAPVPHILYWHAIVFTALVLLLAMQKWLGTQDEADIASLSVPINDMLAFTTCFWLAIFRRRQVEWHRRLMRIASCCLTVAACIHAAYYYVLPAVMLGQWGTVYLATTAPPVWMQAHLPFFLSTLQSPCS